VLTLPPQDARAINPTVSKTYQICGSWTIFLWFIYPIAWGLCEGGNIISPDSEAVFYGVLDLLAKPVFGAILIMGHRNIDPAVLGLRIKDYPSNSEHEKTETGGFGSAAARNNGAGGVVNNGAASTHQHNNAAQAVDGTHNATAAPVSTGVDNNASAV
jgi:bacteriorhodopsin